MMSLFGDDFQSLPSDLRTAMKLSSKSRRSASGPSCAGVRSFAESFFFESLIVDAWFCLWIAPHLFQDLEHGLHVQWHGFFC